MKVTWSAYLDAVEEWTSRTAAVAAGGGGEPPAPLRLEPTGALDGATVARAHAVLGALAEVQQVDARAAA